MRILQGDCREVLKTLPDCSVDSIVTDPPYHLTTGKKGGTGPASASDKTPHGRARVTTGFMGMTWDGGDVAQDPAMWAECLRVLKPGGYLLAFSGTRTYHRMAVAIEDAGFEVRDQIGWLYGSGFPKSHNGEWGGTALKPAWEPICMARKALAGTVEANWRTHGTGALNIDGCRILVEGEDRPPITGRGAIPARQSVDTPREPAPVAQPHELGRWPANLIHDGSDEVVGAFPVTGPSNVRRPTGEAIYGGNSLNSTVTSDTTVRGVSDNGGSAARFFYCAKASNRDRGEGNSHPTVKPTDLMRYLCRLVTPAGGVVLDPFMGSGSTLKAAELEGFSGIGIELSPEYIAIAKRRIAGDAPLFADVELA